MALLLGAWALGNAEAVAWMARGLGATIHGAQRAFVLVVAAVLVVASAGRAPRAVLGLREAAALSALVGLSVLARVGTDIRTLHAAAALVLLGAAWTVVFPAPPGERRWPLWLGLLLALPVQSHLDAHVGIPLRLWTADTVAQLLGALGLGGHRVETVLQLDHGATDVAVACSGVRTMEHVVFLWVLLAWWARGVRRWRLWCSLGAGAAMAAALNVMRVAVLAWWGPAHEAHALGPLVHHWLGLFTLLASCGLMVAVLGARHPAPTKEPVTLGDPRAAAGLAALALLIPAAAPAHVGDVVRPPEVPRVFGWTCEPLPLSASERALVSANDGTTVHKQRCSVQGDALDWVVVIAPGIRAQHAPEVCLMADGQTVQREQRLQGARGPWRVLHLQSGKDALTWFQHAEGTAADLQERAWVGLQHPLRRWALVTVVPHHALAADVQTQLHQTISDAVQPLVSGAP